MAAIYDETPVMAACRNEAHFAAIIDLFVSKNPACLHDKDENKRDALMNAINGSCLEASAKRVKSLKQWKLQARPTSRSAL